MKWILLVAFVLLWIWVAQTPATYLDRSDEVPSAPKITKSEVITKGYSTP